MKKIITLMVAVFMALGMATAQTTVNNGVFSHMYIGISGGLNQTSVSDYNNWNDGFSEGLKSMPYNAGIELGKDVTPITGFSLQALACQNDYNDIRLNRSDVFGNIKFNMMNLFGGYKGYPRRVDIRTVTGIGWNHWFDNDHNNKNDIALQAGLEFDFNLGKNRNWYITFTPMVQSNGICRSGEIQYAAKNADLKANVGVTYRFGKSNESHNFRICDKVYTEEQYAALYNLYDECMSRPVKIDTIIVEKIVEVEKVVETGNVTECVTFAKNSAVITETEMQRLDLYMHSMNKDFTYVVCGSADTNTGSQEYNKELAQKRADAVVKVLTENGFKAETTVKLDALDVTELSRCAIVTKK